MNAMSIELEEQALRQEYRVDSDPSWRVMKRYKGEWVVVYYCKDEAGAYRRLDKCIQQAMKWSRMSETERMSSILRGKQSC